MSTSARLREARCAEEYFELLGVAFDETVLRRSRLHVLRAFGLAMAEIDARRPAPPDPVRLRLYADALRRAHDLHARPVPGVGGGFSRGCGGCRVAAACGRDR
jgi:hypothetical protein